MICRVCAARCELAELEKNGWCYHGKGAYFCGECGCESTTPSPHGGWPVAPRVDISHYTLPAPTARTMMED